MTETVTAPARKRTPEEVAAIRRNYGLKKGADARKAARIKAIKASYVEAKKKAWVAEKIAAGKERAKQRRIAESYSRKTAA